MLIYCVSLSSPPVVWQTGMSLKIQSKYKRKVFMKGGISLIYICLNFKVLRPALKWWENKLTPPNVEATQEDYRAPA